MFTPEFMTDERNEANDGPVETLAERLAFLQRCKERRIENEIEEWVSQTIARVQRRIAARKAQSPS